MPSSSLAKGYMATVGVVLVAVGLLGFMGNPVVGDAANSPLFITGTNHNAVHILTGLLAIYVAFGLSGATRTVGAIGFGLLYLVIFAALLVSPDLFGLLYPVSVADHFLHAGLGVVSVGVGVLARGTASTMAA